MKKKKIIKLVDYSRSFNDSGTVFLYGVNEDDVNLIEEIEEFVSIFGALVSRDGKYIPVLTSMVDFVNHKLHLPHITKLNQKDKIIRQVIEHFMDTSVDTFSFREFYEITEKYCFTAI